MKGWEEKKAWREMKKQKCETMFKYALHSLIYLSSLVTDPILSKQWQVWSKQILYPLSTNNSDVSLEKPLLTSFSGNQIPARNLETERKK